MKLSRNLPAFAASALLLIGALLHIPLAFCRLTGELVPLYGLAELVTFPVLTLFSGAVLCAFPFRTWQLCRRRELRRLLVGAGIFLLVNLGHSLFGGLPWNDFMSAAFFVLAPAAAAVLAPELRKILPFFAAATAVLLLWSGFFSENFTGLTGNWNWTQGLIAALLPGIFAVLKIRHRQIWALTALVLVFLIIGIFYHDEFSRSILIAIPAVSAIIFWRDRLPQKKFARYWLFTAGALAVLMFAAVLVLNLPDTRFQIWKGTAGMIMENPLTGVGWGQFSENIRQYCRQEFFFSPFPALQTEHAHNDLLNLFAQCGIAGVWFYFAASCAIFRRRIKTPVNRFLFWIAGVLLICGLFDQHNITVTGGVYLCAAAGCLLAPRRYSTDQCPFPAIQSISWACAVLLSAAAANSAVTTYRAASLLRQGDLARNSKNYISALEHYTASMNIKATPEALYNSGELFLLIKKPARTLEYISQLESEFSITNYCHAQRLKGIAAWQTGDFETALTAFEKETANAPFSLINAHFMRGLLRQINAPAETIKAADEHFLSLCRMRNITPEKINTVTLEFDDAPFTPEVRQEKLAGSDFYGGIALEIFSSIVLLLAVYGIGRTVLLRYDTDHLAALAAGILLCGMAALVIPVSILKYAMFIPALPGICFAFNDLKKEWKTVLFFTAAGIFLLGAALLPPSAWDEQVYQIALLKRYAAANSTAVCMDNPYSAYPSLGQLWLLPGFAYGGLCVPAVILTAVNMIMAGKFWILGRRFGKLPAFMALTAVILSPLTWGITRVFYVESFIVLAGFAGSVLLMRSKDSNRIGVLLAGAMAGMAAAVKLTGAGVSLLLFVLLLCDREKRRHILFFIAGGALAALPFFLRVWIDCGNPFYPYFSSLTGAGQSACMVEEFHHILGSNYGTSAVSGILKNLVITAWQGSIFDGIVTGLQFPLLAAIPVLAAIISRGCDKRILHALAAFSAAWIFWNFTAQQTRFLYPLLWFAAFLTLYSCGVFSAKIRQAVLIIMAAAICLTLYLERKQLIHYSAAWGTLREARKSPVHFAAWNSKEEIYAEIAQQLQELKDHKTALLWERRTLYLPENVQIVMPGFQETLTPVPQDADTLYRALQKFDFVMIRPPRADVDKGIEFVPDALKLNDMIFELLKAGKLSIYRCTSDGALSILRIEPGETDGTPAQASS